MLVISDSSPLIALSRIDRLDLLQKLYKRILIPKAVEEEVFSNKGAEKTPPEKPSWIKTKTISQPLSVEVLSITLGRGESEAIALALELKADIIILDELAARSLATELNLRFTGILGILLKAKENNLLPSVKEVLDSLIKHEFRISSSLYSSVLALSHEK